MGWTFTFETDKKRFIKDITSPSHWGKHFIVHQHSTVGNVVYVPFEIVDEETGQVRCASVAIFLIAKDRNDGWGYKDMEESCGPYKFTAPMRIINWLEAHPHGAPVNEYAKNWREKVKQYHATKKRNKATPVSPGQQIEVYGRLFELDNNISGRLGWHAYEIINGQRASRYRLTAKQVANAKRVPIFAETIDINTSQCHDIQTNEAVAG